MKLYGMVHSPGFLRLLIYFLRSELGNKLQTHTTLTDCFLYRLLYFGEYMRCQRYETNVAIIHSSSNFIMPLLYHSLLEDQSPNYTQHQTAKFNIGLCDLYSYNTPAPDIVGVLARPPWCSSWGRAGSARLPESSSPDLTQVPASRAGENRFLPCPT